MSDQNDQDAAKSRLSLRPAGGRLELGKTVDAGSVRQSFSHGRSKVVQVEVRKKRATVAPAPAEPAAPIAAVVPGAPPRPVTPARPPAGAGRALTATEIAVRQRVLAEQVKDAVDKGATLHAGGVLSDGPDAHFTPAVLTGITEDMRAYREELFGPVAVVYKVGSDE